MQISRRPLPLKSRPKTLLKFAFQFSNYSFFVLAFPTGYQQRRAVSEEIMGKIDHWELALSPP
jgi:hypothetical protein